MFIQFLLFKNIIIIIIVRTYITLFGSNYKYKIVVIKQENEKNIKLRFYKKKFLIKNDLKLNFITVILKILRNLKRFNFK